MDQRAEQLGRMRTDMPILRFPGTGIRWEKTKEVSERCISGFQTQAARDITLGFYKDARHELFNETNREEVREDLLSWILGHLEEQNS